MTGPRKPRPAPRPVDLAEIKALFELAAQQPPLPEPPTLASPTGPSAGKAKASKRPRTE